MSGMNQTRPDGYGGDVEQQARRAGKKYPKSEARDINVVDHQARAACHFLKAGHAGKRIQTPQKLRRKKNASRLLFFSENLLLCKKKGNFWLLKRHQNG